ncbi:MAG: MFS transporter [Faecousia sp.]
MNKQAVQRKFGMRDKLGYMFGDFGNDFTFVLASMFLMKFYTDVMGVRGATVGLMMMLARFVDAFTDIAMGQIVDRSKPTKKGKFLPWIRRMCGPVAVASLLMYASWMEDMPMTVKVIWMFVTYLLWGSVFYTSINIPYGSMASAISSDPKQRAELSKWRTIGATLASMIIGVVLPLTVYYKDAQGNNVVSGIKMTTAAAVCSVCAVICYFLCYKMTTERVKIERKEEKFNLKEFVHLLVHNKALIAIVISTLAAIIAQTTLGGMSTYIYPNYFGNTKAQAVSTAAGVLITLLCSFFVVRLTERFGRRGVGIGAACFSSVILILTIFLHTKNPWLFVFLYALVYGGYGMFSLITWAMITDVIDDAQVKTGTRSDGMIYSVYSFSRKLGQAAATGLYGLLLTMVGYTQATAFDPGVTEGIYYITCAVPLAGFLILALVLKFMYPLSKDRVLENARCLSEKEMK